MTKLINYIYIAKMQLIAKMQNYIKTVLKLCNTVFFNSFWRNQNLIWKEFEKIKRNLFCWQRNCLLHISENQNKFKGK